MLACAHKQDARAAVYDQPSSASVQTNRLVSCVAMHPVVTRLLIALRGATQWTVLLPVVCLLLHLIPSVSPRIRTLARVVCRNLVTTVTVAYWLIIAVYPDFINLPGQPQLTLTEALIHSLPFLVTLLVIGRVKQPVSQFASFLVGASIMLLYLLYIHWAYHFHTAARWWPYPFMNNLSAHAWITLAGGSVAGFAVLHCLFARIDGPRAASAGHQKPE